MQAFVPSEFNNIVVCAFEHSRGHIYVHENWHEFCFKDFKPSLILLSLNQNLSHIVTLTEVSYKHYRDHIISQPFYLLPYFQVTLQSQDACFVYFLVNFEY